MPLDRFAELRKKEAERLMKLREKKFIKEQLESEERNLDRAKSVMEARGKFAMKKPEAPKQEESKSEGKGTLARFQPDYFKQKSPEAKGYSKEVSELTQNQLSNIKVNPKNPLTVMKPLRPNILDRMAVENVNWLAAQRRRAGTKWVPVQQF